MRPRRVGSVSFPSSSNGSFDTVSRTAHAEKALNIHVLGLRCPYAVFCLLLDGFFFNLRAPGTLVQRLG